MTTFVILPANLDDPRVAALLATHAATARAETGRGSAHALDLDGLKAPGIIVWAGWRDGSLVGVGALKRLSATEGEVKSMHTTIAARRAGVGRRMLDHILAAAENAGLRGSASKPARGPISNRRARSMRRPVSQNAGRSATMSRIRTASS